LQQVETRRHGDAILTCQHNGQDLAAIRLLEEQQRNAAGASTCRSAELLLCPSMQEESAPWLCSALAVSAALPGIRAFIVLPSRRTSEQYAYA
jgi:hypothetical protein